MPQLALFIPRARASIVARALALAIGLTAILSGTAQAQSSPDQDAMAQAREHFQRAERHFATGQFESAVAGYQAAYDAAPLPDLLFNIAQCYRQLRQHDQAIFAYQKYLQEKPDALNRDYVERTIAELQRQRDIEAARRLRLTPPTGNPGPADSGPQTGPGPIYKRWWFVTGAVVLAGAATTGILLTRDTTPDSDLGTLDFRKQ